MSNQYTLPDGSVVELVGKSGSPDTPSTPSPKEVSQLESALRGAAQGVTLGFADELTGGVESALGSLGLVEDKTYEQAKDEARLANKLAQEANSKSYMGGEILGGIGAAVIPGGLATKAGGKVAQLAAAASQFGKASPILTGASLGAASGLGSSEAEDFSEMAKDTLKGAAVGGAIGAVAKGVGAGVDAYKGSKLRGLVQEGRNIDDKLLPITLREEAARDVGKTLTGAKDKLIGIRDELVSKLDDYIPMPGYDAANISRLEKITKSSGEFAVELEDLAAKLANPLPTARELVQLNTQVNKLNEVVPKERLALKEFLNDISAKIKQSLPSEISEANQVYHQFGANAIEPNLLGGKQMGKFGKGLEGKLTTSVEDLINKLKSKDPEAINTLKKLQSGLQSTAESSPGLLDNLAVGGKIPYRLSGNAEIISNIPRTAVTDKISQTAEQIAALEAKNLPFKASLSSLAKNPFSGLVKFGAENLESLGGRAVGGVAKAEKWSSEAFQTAMKTFKDLTPEALVEKAQALMQNESTAKLGMYLMESIKSGNIAKKNAAMFSALQNPQARAIVMPAKAEQEQE